MRFTAHHYLSSAHLWNSNHCRVPWGPTICSQQNIISWKPFAFTNHDSKTSANFWPHLDLTSSRPLVDYLFLLLAHMHIPMKEYYQWVYQYPTQNNASPGSKYSPTGSSNCVTFICYRWLSCPKDEGNIPIIILNALLCTKMKWNRLTISYFHYMLSCLLHSKNTLPDAAISKPQNNMVHNKEVMYLWYFSLNACWIANCMWNLKSYSQHLPRQHKWATTFFLNFNR